MRAVLLLIALTLTPGCVKLTLAWADLGSNGPLANPAILESSQDLPRVASANDWEERRLPAVKEALETHVYGVMPDAAKTKLVKHTILDEEAFGGAGRFEEYVISATVEFNGVARDSEFIMAVALPKTIDPAPVILMETFCPRWSVLPNPSATKPEGARDMGGFIGGVATFVFGRYICTPPVEEILNAGYAIATIYPGEFVPDRAEEGLAELRRLSAGHEDNGTRWGAVAAWGWAFSRMVDVLEGDPRYDKDAMIVWGHSRYGKAALVAAAYDPRIDGVISHQSGTGGASLNRRKKGESIRAITEGYPHWFSKAYARYAGREEAMPVDQHHLLALIAPRPVLLGNARRDVWSDPNGAFRAAIGADPVYELYGSEGLNQKKLNQFDPDADLSFWIRSGTHGVVKEDWPAFLKFLDAHFKNAGS